MLVAVEDAVGYGQVICCHLVDTLGNADDGRHVAVAAVSVLLRVRR